MPRPAPRYGEPSIEIDGVRYPLVLDGSGRAADIQRRPLTQFAAANAIGPNERPPKNPALSSITFLAQTQRGMGTYKHAVLDGIDTFRRATLDTRFMGGVLPPPRVDTLAQAPMATSGGNWNLAVPVQALPLWATTGIGAVTGTYWYEFSTAGRLLYHDIAANTWANIAGGALALIQWGGYVVRINAGTSDIETASPAAPTAFTTRDTAQWRGLAAFANRLWSFNLNDRKLYSCTDPTLAIGGGTGAWTAQSGALAYEYGEVPTSLFVYRDKGGNPALFVASHFRLIGYDDDSGEFETYQDLRQMAGGASYPLVHAWERDKTLYAIPFAATGEAQRHVYQFAGNVDEVGPTERGGFDKAAQFSRFRALSGNTHWLYAAGEGDGTNAAGEVVAFNEQGGWHTVYHPTSVLANQIVSLCAVGGDIYTMFKDGTFQAIRDKDTLTAPQLRYVAGEIDTGPHHIYCGKTDFGLPNHEKIGAYVYVATRKIDGTYGLPSGATLTVWYSVDGAPLVLLVTLTSADAIPRDLPLPANDPLNQYGIPCREIEVYAQLTCTGEPAVIEELTPYWQRYVRPRWAYQAVIDLREETVRRFQGSTYEEGGLGTLRATFETMVAAKQLHQIRYGGAEWSVYLASADLVVAGRESPLDGSGLFPITFRDVAAN